MYSYWLLFLTNNIQTSKTLSIAKTANSTSVTCSGEKSLNQEKVIHTELSLSTLKGIFKAFLHSITVHSSLRHKATATEDTHTQKSLTWIFFSQISVI